MISFSQENHFCLELFCNLVVCSTLKHPDPLLSAPNQIVLFLWSSMIPLYTIAGRLYFGSIVTRFAERKGYNDLSLHK